MDDVIKFMLKEDEGFGDITSNALIPEDKTFYAKLVSKDDGILAGIDAGIVDGIPDPAAGITAGI